MQLLVSEELGLRGTGCLAQAEIRGRMEERFAHAVGQGTSVVALLCEPTGLTVLEREHPQRAPLVLQALTRALEPAFEPAEVLVARDDALLVMLVGSDPARLEAACGAWIAAARSLTVDGLDAPQRVGLRIGYGVTQPGKRQFLETLIQVAREGLRVARCRSGSACVHTRLYDILQGRLEQKLGRPGVAIADCAPIVPGAPERKPANPRPATAATVAPRSIGAGNPVPDRERALHEALEAQRRENEALRARLQALESVREAPAPVPVETTPEPEASDRVIVLERRLEKLMLSLEQAEKRLAEVERPQADTGLRSVHRTVQGLASDEPQFDEKSALMHHIFEANRRLREQLATWRGQVLGNGAA
jgi:hypothetical protein